MSVRIVVDNIRIPMSCDDKQAIRAARKKLTEQGISFSENTLHIHKKSVDARRKSNITFVCSVTCESDDASILQKKYEGIRVIENEELTFGCGEEKMEGRPYIVGFGPAGIFCGLILASFGLRPVILERGDEVSKRVAKIDDFYKTGKLDKRSQHKSQYLKRTCRHMQYRNVEPHPQSLGQNFSILHHHQRKYQ